MESVYWVFTLRCNDFCPHCYNNSGPKGETITLEELLKVVPNLPPKIGRIILSGGEPLVEKDKLRGVVAAIRKKYSRKTQIFLQSNGDLLSDKVLAELEEMTIDRIDIVSVDRFHKKQGRHVETLRGLFLDRGWTEHQEHAIGNMAPRSKVFSFWGANEKFWVGGLWARGRALSHSLENRDPKKNFCAQWSGAIGFLDSGSPQQEIHIQLYRLYPCCPTTLFSIGDVRDHAVEALLDNVSKNPTFQTLNKGDVYVLGTADGLTPEYIRSRIEALGDVCLWCDEYFDDQYRGSKGERRKSE